MKKILLFAAAAMLAFAACEEKDPTPTPNPGPETEVCPDCGKNPCECTTPENDYELFLSYDVKLQHGVNTNYEGTVVTVDGSKVCNFFGMTEDEFYLAMGSLDSGAQVNNTLLFGLCYQDAGEWVYDFTPSTTNNYGHWMTKDGLVTSWGADSFMFTENRGWWGYESLEAAIADGMAEGAIWQFTYGIHPDFYDGQVGDTYTATDFIFDQNTQKTCYITYNVQIVDFIDEEAENYKGAPSSAEASVDLTVGTPVALTAMQEAFQLSKFQFNAALLAGQISTVNYIDGVQVDPSAGGFGGVWFDAEGKRTVWGTGDETNAPACYYIELISSAKDLSAYSGYYGEDSAAQVAGKSYNNFKQVVTYTPAESESYTFTINYNVAF